MGSPGVSPNLAPTAEYLLTIMIGPRHRTVVGVVTLSGAGVHSGRPSTLSIHPAEPEEGIRFHRTDLPDPVGIPADVDHVLSTDLGTTIGVSEDHRVMTVEHVMAALAATGVSCARIEIDGPEPPILDGSFLPYLEAIEAVGTRELEDEVPVIRLREPIHVETGEGTSYVVTPGSGFRIAGAIDFEHPVVGRQFGSFELSGDRFRTEIAPARTFGFEDQAEALHSRGLARGTSLDNTVVVGQDRVLNETLRFPDEFLRHKIGDVLGDLALLGARIEGQILVERPSHTGNVELARTLQVKSRRSGEGDAIVDAQKILQYLPHRYPMLLVDRVTHFEPGRRIVGVKNVTINEPFFQGHYPGHPIMPGVLIIEAMAQVGGLLLMDTIENPDEKVVYFMSLNNVKWRRPVTPGDRLIFELELLQFRRSICKMRGEGFVDGTLVAEAELMARVVDR